MFTTYNPTYSTQPAGKRTRILATDTDVSGRLVTKTLVTLDPEDATVVARELTALHTRRLELLYAEARDLNGKVSQLRRTLMGAVSAGTAPAAHAAVAGLAEAVAVLADAERRAVSDEVGRLFAGTDDILVPVDLTDEFGGVLFATLANGFLAGATGEELLELVDPHDENGVLYEGLLAHLRTGDEAINAACNSGWVDVSVDQALVVAWIRRNRSDLTAQVDELRG